MAVFFGAEATGSTLQCPRLGTFLSTEEAADYPYVSCEETYTFQNLPEALS